MLDKPPAWCRGIAALGGARLTIGQALLALIGLVGLGIGLGLIIIQTGQYRQLTPANPTLVVDDILSVVLTGGQSARVRVTILPVSGTLPDNLELLSPIYEVEARGSVELRFNVADHPSAAGRPDLYRRDERSGGWQFVPAGAAGLPDQLVIGLVEGPVALFLPETDALLIGTALEGTQTFDTGRADVLDLLLVDGITVGDQGMLDAATFLQNVPPGDDYVVFPLLRVEDEEVLSGLLSNEAEQEAHMQSIVALISGQPWAGVALDYGAVGIQQSEALNALIGRLADVLRQNQKRLAVWVPTPAVTPSGWDTKGYDWGQIGALADIVIVRPPGGPGDFYPGGPVDTFLDRAAAQINRSRLFLAFSALSMDEWNGEFYPIAYSYALAPLGTVSVTMGSSEAALQPVPGQPLTFTLSGQATDFEWDERTGLYRYSVYTGDGEHHVWVMNAAALRSRLDQVSAHNIGGVLIEDLMATGISPATMAAIQEFRDGRPPLPAPPLVLNWQITDENGTVLFEASGELGTPLTWTPEREGTFTISADLVGEDVSHRGAAAVRVSKQVESPASVPVNTLPPLIIPEGMPIPVFPPGVAAFGNFELGGQVNQVIRYPDLMRQSGMRWVKFQLTWGPGQSADTAWNYIEQGRSMGFRVLLSIVSGEKYPAAIDIPAYIEFLRNVAYYGPDAIEIWNEPNYYFEWPRGQISGTAYVRDMLAPAYNAIKEINPNIIVISGALLPTGLYYSEGGCSAQGYGCDDWYYLQQMAQAGAANYMDCVGVHYNAGATPPSATSGHPADPGYQHYSWYFGSMLQLYGGTFGHPVCFTELGYLSPEGYGGLPANFNWAANTTVAEQAAWLAEAVQLSRQSGQVRLMIIWNVDFDYWGADDPKAGYAIVRPGGTCPACNALDSVMP